MLGWSMVNLAKAARLSVSTVKRFENGAASDIFSGSMGQIQDALETEGVRFLANDGTGPGVRLRQR